MSQHFVIYTSWVVAAVKQALEEEEQRLGRKESGIQERQRGFGTELWVDDPEAEETLKRIVRQQYPGYFDEISVPIPLPIS